MSVDVHPYPRDGTPIRLLVAGLFLGPLAALGDLQIAYLLVDYACAAGTTAPLHAVHVVMVLTGLAGVWCGWLAHRKAGGGAPHSDAGRLARTRFLGLVGMLLSGLLTLVVVGQWLADFVLSPCQ